MALQRRPDNYEDARERLLTYCREYNITHPFYDYPFEWVEPDDRQQSPPPELPGILPNVNVGYLDESLDWTSGVADCMCGKVAFELHDVLDIRDSKPFEYEMLPPHPFLGPNILRKFGPTSLKKVTPLLQADVLCGEESMDIPTDTSEVLKAFENDSKITATREQAGFLKDVIFTYNHEKSVDLIHSNVQCLF